MSKPIDIRMLRARSQLIVQEPFFGALAMRLRLVERNDIKTMATDGEFLFYCRAFLDAMTEGVTRFTVAHEVLHCALSHHTRRGSRDHLRWNKACDYVVNLLLKKAGSFDVPEWVLLNERFDGMGAEEVYRILEHEEQQQKQQQQPDPNQDQDDQQQDDTQSSSSGGDQDPNDDQQDDDQSSSDGSQDQDDQDDPNQDDDDKSSDDGQGSDDQDGDQQDDAGNGGDNEDDNETDADGESGGGQSGTNDGDQPSKMPPSFGDPGGCGEVLDAAPEHDEAAMHESRDEWQVYTRQAASIARRQGEGVLPGFIEEVVDELDDPKTDWRSQLDRFVEPCNHKDLSWSKPNRRMMSMGFYTPGPIDDGVHHVAVLIDTSISIDYDWLKKFGGEAQAALDSGRIDKITLVFIDEQVHRTAEYGTGEIIDFTVQGRGGTAFSPGFKWVNDNLPDAAAAIYFTDLECSDFGEQPHYPVLWAVYGSNPSTMQFWIERVPWGEVVELKD